MLTDGSVGDRESVIRQASLYNDRIRVHTFGIGSGCDKTLVERTAKAGRGTCSLAGDHDK